MNKGIKKICFAGAASLLIVGSAVMFSMLASPQRPAEGMNTTLLGAFIGQNMTASVSGAYGQANYATPIQIQSVGSAGTSQVLAIASGGTLGTDTGSAVDLSLTSLKLPGGFSLGANSAIVPAGDTLSSAVGSTVNLSSGTVTLPTITAGSFAGSNGTANATLAGAKVGQQVIAVWDQTGGSLGATAPQGYFATSITTSGVITQTSTANLTGHGYSALLLNQGP